MQWNEVHYLHKLYWKTYDSDARRWIACDEGGSFDYTLIFKAIYNRRLIWTLFQLLYNYPQAYYEVKGDIAFMFTWAGLHVVTFSYMASDYIHLYYLISHFITFFTSLPLQSRIEWSFVYPEFKWLIDTINENWELPLFELRCWYCYFSRHFSYLLDLIIKARSFYLILSVILNKIYIFMFIFIKYYMMPRYILVWIYCIIDSIHWWYSAFVHSDEFLSNLWFYRYHYIFDRLYITDITKIIYLIIQDILNNFIYTIRLHRHPMDIIWLNVNYFNTQINNYRDLWLSYLRVDPIILKQFYTPFILPGILNVLYVCLIF
jgi:hypothetical protein